jgi:succinate dehydrogenase/fumarate reductase flavoprotein subunit
MGEANILQKMPMSPFQEVNWDREADVVVIGYGGTGAVAAITVNELGGKVIALEKAPEPGGTTSTSTGAMRVPNDAESAARFIEAAGLGSVDKETARSFAETWMRMLPWLEQHDIPLSQSINALAPYQNLPGAGAIDRVLLPGGTGGNERGCGRDLFAHLHSHVEKMNIPVMLDSPARRLIQNPATREVCGVIADESGKTINIKAKKAVIMVCGGFAGNREMLAQYVEPAPIPICTSGTPYSTGDGINMALDVGADLWHMPDVEWARQGFKPPELPAAFWLNPRKWNWINVNKLGIRFRDESTTYHHGKKHLEVFRFESQGMRGNAEWLNHPWYMIFDETVREAGPIIMTERFPGSPSAITYNMARELYDWSQDNGLEIERGWISVGDSIEELATKVGIDPQGLESTVTQYNEFCNNGSDMEFHRDRGSLHPIANPPYYAIECAVNIVNTQGGPRRNAKGQVMGGYGSPIPRLYAGGELGSIWGFLYPGGCNLSECIVSGIIAGENAMAERPW